MKASMAGQKIDLSSRIASAYHIFRSYREGTLGDPIKDIRHHRALLEIIHTHFGPSTRNVKILDLGCGQVPKQVALFNADGYRAVGIDMEVPTPSFNVSALMRALRNNGVERALKSAARNLLFDKKYHTELSRNYGMKVPFHDLDIRIMNATEMSFDDGSFDFVFSESVFEHIDDIDKATMELNRILDEYGLARISIHLFPSISGGHHLEWIHPDTKTSGTVPPWDHLREAKYKVNTYLNRHRMADYRKVFGKNLRIIAEELRPEGTAFLTPEITESLAKKGFTRDDLLTRNIVFTCRKKL